MPALNTTIGFEAEFNNNVDALGHRLYAEGLVAQPTMHRWHCDCDICTDYESHGFHLQTDSSCGGEVISRVLRTTDDLDSLTEALQAAAFAVDAEPGTTAGFHVHVKPHRLRSVRYKCLWNYMRWEETLLLLSAGAFAQYRGVNMKFTNEAYVYRDNGYPGERARFAVQDGWDFDDVDWEATFECAEDLDRHCTLNLRGGPGTWEFRLWNSTRAAWRMQMFAGLSSAFVNKDFTTIVADEDSTDTGTLISALDLAGYSRTAEHVTRQVAFLARNDVPVAPTFTR
mgnify:CR=1 FL=1